MSLSHIAEPDPLGCQVRIMHQGRKISRYFSYSLYGGREQALKTAIAWRDLKLAWFNKRSLRFSHLEKRRASSGINGISRVIKWDQRCQKHYLCYLVFWQQQNQRKLRNFQAGNVNKIDADMDLHSFRSARLFRICYEFALEEQLNFHSEVFNEWKTQRLYDQSDFYSRCFSSDCRTK